MEGINKVGNFGRLSGTLGMMHKCRKEQSIIKLLVYGTMLLLCVLFVAILPLGHDLHFHLYRIGAMAEELERTSFSIPIRILSVSYNNYGYGVPIFYGDLLLYIPAVLVMFGMEVVTAFKLLLVGLFLLSFATMYHQIYRSSASKEFAFLAAVFYVFSPYFLLDLCIRMAIGEACACVFLPFVFCSFYNILYQPKKGDWFYLTIGMSGLILSHNLTAAFTAGILGIWAILQLHRVINRKAVGSIVLAALTTVGLTASYTFAFVEANMVQAYHIPGNNGYQMEEFVKRTFELVDFFLPYDIKKGMNVLFHLNWDTEVWRPGAIGVSLLAILLLAVKTRKYKKNRVLLVWFWVSVFLYLCMYIRPVLEWAKHYISFIQFGWRLLLFSTFAFTIYTAYLLHHYFGKCWQTAYVILAILTALYTLVPRYVYQIYLNHKGMEYIMTINEEYYEHYIMEYSPNSGDTLYLPEGVNGYLYEERGERVDCNHGDVKYEFVRQDNKCRLIVSDNSYDDTTFELPLYYYKGYAAVDRNTGKYLTVSPSENKLVAVSLNGSMREADLEIWYRGTFVQTLGNWISGVVFLALLLYVIFCFRSSRHLKGKEKNSYI